MKAHLQLRDIEEMVFERDHSLLPVSGDPLILDLEIPILNNSRFQLREHMFNGARVSYSNIAVKKNLELTGGMDESTIEMHFNLKGNSSATMDGAPPNSKFEIPENGHFITSMPRPRGTFNFYENETVECLEINFKKEYLERFFHVKSYTLDKLLNSIEKEQLWHTSLEAKMHSGMHKIIHNITHNPYLGETRKLYVEYQIAELLQIQLCTFDSSDKPYPALNKTDIEKLYHARSLALNDELDLPNLHDLSIMVGLNEFKLKSGFRALFGETVYGMVLSKRMERAFGLLAESNLSIADIAFLSGYCHQQHFTTAFKKKFDITPGKVRRLGRY